MDASHDAPADHDLRTAIEAALKPGARLLTMPPELERRYQAATWRGRSRSLKSWLYVLALMDFMCIGIDALVMPAHLTEAVIARGLVLTSIYLGAAALLTRLRPVWMQGLLILVPTVSLILVAGYLANLAGGVHAERYLLAGLFTIFASTIVPNVAFRWVVAQAVLSVLSFGAMLFALSGDLGGHWLVDNIELVTFFPVSILVALHVRRWIERMHRRNFVMSLRDELRVQELALSKARSDATLANMSQGIVMRDANGLVAVINRRAIELLELPESFLTRPLYGSEILAHQRARAEFNNPSLPPGVLARIATGNEGDVPPLYERTRPDGTVLEVRTTTLPDGAFVRTFADVTERKQIEIALAKARDIAEAASRARSEFLAMMSHEIRTPMNAVLGLTGSLLETKLDEDQRKSAEAIQEASDGLLNILNDILDLSKLDAGKLEFEQLPFSLESVIDNTKSIVSPRAAEKGLVARVEVDPDLPRALIGDANRMRQIVLNLASNAVKFTTSGEVVISARCLERDTARATVRVAVSDTGIGIAPDRLSRLFTDFVQADASIHRQYGGTGLGLAICKRLVDQLGGEISVESAPGCGTTFAFKVSLALADLADLEQRGAPDTTVGLSELLARLGRPLRVLVAEDNITNQLVVTRMLREFAVELQIVQNGVEAVAAAAQGGFDAIFMDMRMPEMDGLEATRAIRARGGALAAIPIIALTANAFADDIKACRDAGMNDFVAKPIRKRLLVEKLAKIVQAAVPGAVGSAALAPAAAAEETAPGAPQNEDILIDRSILVELCDEIGADSTGEILRVFLDETRERLALLDKLSEAGDCAAIEVEAHTLKGAAGAVGFAQVSALAKALESQARNAAPLRYDAQVARIGAAFRESCREMERHPLTGSLSAA